jgi:hypothetical protein
MKPYRYRLSYTIDWKAEPGEDPQQPGITKEALAAAERGGADALVWVSILYPPDGSYSVAYHSLDGATNDELSAAEMFKMATTLLVGLGQRNDATPELRDLCEGVRRMITTLMKGPPS